MCEYKSNLNEHIHLNGKCFHIHTNPSPWFSARKRCSQDGMDLAVLNNEDTLKELSLFVKESHQDNYRWFWVGKRKTDYISESGNHNHYQSVIYIHTILYIY